MDTSVSISNARDNELQFDITVEGTDVSDMRARFVIETDDMEYVFPCKQSSTPARWIVNIPKMPHLKRGEYDFHVEIITNGYYFDPYKGRITVTAEPTVSQSSVTKNVPVPVVKAVAVKVDEPKKEEKKAEVKEQTKSDTEELVDAFLKSKQKNPVVESKKDKAVKAALEDLKKKVKEAVEPEKKITTKKRIVESKSPPKKRVVRKVVDDSRSNLEQVIENIDVPKDKQALKVHNIINSVNQDTD